MKNLPYLGALTAAWARMNLGKARTSCRRPEWVLYLVLFFTGAAIGFLAFNLATLLSR